METYVDRDSDKLRQRYMETNINGDRDGTETKTAMRWKGEGKKE